MDDVAAFHLRLHGSCPAVWVAGEVDQSNVHLLDAAIEELFAHAELLPLVEIDLTRTAFIGSVVASSLVTASHRRPVRVRVRPGPVLRILSVLGLHEVLDLHIG